MISAWDCFHLATLELVRSTPIKQRLVCAYRRYLVSLPPDEMPNELRDSFGSVMRSLCGVAPLRGEDAVAASVRKMSNQDADDCAAQIVEIFGLMCRTHHNTMRTTNVVQLHSVDRAIDEFSTPALTASN
ncbi:MAG: hypothetical protein QOK23_1434 [Gammaproteobacteria bacterium]|jgi:hypothetical protein|nr:hypothetical protein [Gammaproteobacteria bacterium]